MGLRAASVRHPNAVVMAPALTEAGQSQNFTLPSSSPSVSQNGGYTSHNDKLHTSNGIKKCNSYNGDLFDITSDYLNTPVTEHKVHSSRKLASGFQQFDSGNSIMNTCPTSMGDQENDVTMGLQKTGMDSMATLLKDKSIISPDVEQLFNNLTAVTDSASDIGQNVEDLMQVIKNMEGERGGVQSTDGEIFPIAFDRELFGEVDMMGICGEDDALTQSQLKETRAKEMLEELHKKQLKLERRSEFLLRRLRKIQTRGMGGHVSGEVAGLYEFIHRSLQRVKETAPSIKDINPSDYSSDVPIEIELSQPIEQLPPVKPLSPQTMTSLVQMLHTSALQQSTSLSRQKNVVVRYFGAGSSEQSSRVLPASVLSVPTLPKPDSDELEHVAGVLQSELAMVESQVDSDATASSSGAESCDEMQSYNNPHQQYLSISRRAAWRYANERAAVASRWTWLQAQISDLEYRIRQHNELHRQIRLCKGAVTLGDAHSTVTNAISTPASPSTVNGYRGQLPGATKSSSTDDLLNGAISSGAAASCARTRPLQKSTFRKRKLLQTTGLHTVSKKASRPSNIRCGCVPPVVPCALCTGRTDPTFPRDLPEQLTVPERIALLDPGYHPVLSFPDDISQSIHLEAIMKVPDWQQKMLRCNMKSLKGMSKSDRVDKSVTGLEVRSKKSEHRKKYNKLLKSGNTNTLPSKIKTKIGRGRKPFSRGISGMIRVGKKRHNSAKMAMAQLHALASESMDEEMEALGVPASVIMQSRAMGDSLSPSPLSHVVPYRRNRVDSYDIDNIVIPYSVAASTRVEKLQYKEILTPKWRVIDTDFPAKYDEKNNGIVRRASGDSEVEDMSEEVIGIRHDKCEHDERKKFLSYIKFPLTVGRPRANRRTDSRAESSGANTPDPMSPHNNNTMLMDGLDSTVSPLLLTSPPATPIMNQNDDSSTSQHLHHTTSALRRRTVSQSRWARDREETRSNTPEIIEPARPPFDLRSFPLTDEKYEKMLRHMPEGHPLPNICFNKQVSRDSDNTESASSPIFPDEVRPIESPISDSTESAIAEEDPNDPEWFDVERVRERSKR